MPESLVNTSTTDQGQSTQLYGSALVRIFSYVVLALFPLIALAISRISTPSLDPREPPLLKPTIPVVGHLVNMLHKGGKYYLEMYESSQGKLSTATLSIFGQKIYLIASPSLAQAALRNRLLSFDPFVVQASDGLVRLSAKAKELFVDGTLLHAFSTTVSSATSPEPMRRMTVTALAAFTDDLNALAAGPGHQQEIQHLYHFLRNRIAMAATDSLYGIKTNPFRHDPRLVDDIWTFDDALTYLFPNIKPEWIAPAGNSARERLQHVLVNYYKQFPDESSFPPDVAEFTKLRARIIRNSGLSDTDLGRLEVGMVVAATTNSAPMFFWFLISVMSRPQILAKVREEVEPLVTFGKEDISGPSGAAIKVVATFRTSQLTDSIICPYITAAHRETLRLFDSNTATRHVLDDTTLPDGTLLRAGGICHIPAGVGHRIPEAWGDRDPNEFAPERWLEHQVRMSGSSGITQKMAFWPFGGGKHLCPGRNFAINENITLLAALVTGFDCDGLVVPECPIANLTGQSVPPPKKQVKATFKRREGWEHVVWKLEY
ncbi:hypothetical protein CMEL01_09160 [Colletotrichum melonis]|uniref:Prostacyclin synthase n=1 Tax=Colletotrichum melonis TaxID=1209925 RepID=A0AAI9TZ33_9PEZI|nr:hypothetical protein CMEL01_09160 [Colletotrichum melonis]